MSYIEVGLIANTYGIKGQLKIKAYTNIDRFAKNKQVYIKMNDKDYLSVKIKSSFKQKNCEIVKLEGFDEINEVLKFKGLEVYISEDQQKPLESGFYYHELIGKKVYNQLRELKGIVTEVLDYPHADMLVIKTANKNKMIPFIDEFVKAVEEDRIIINEIEGLL